MIKKLTYAFSIVAALFVGVLGHIYFTQEHRIFRMKPLSQDHAFTFEETFEEIYFHVDHDAQVHALYFTVEKPKGVVLFFHGQGGNLESKWGKVASRFTKRGYNVLIPDYRQTGKSLGPLSEEAILGDGLHVYNYLQERHPNQAITLYGCSLGTSIATYVASQRNPKMLILESPYLSLIDMAPRNAPAFLPNFVLENMLRFPFRTDLWIHQVRAPIHIFHGTDDTIVPYDSSLRLIDQLEDSSHVTFVSLDETTHRTVTKHPDYHATLDSLLR